YNYLYNTSSVCEKCSHDKKFISLVKGYAKCEYCINNEIDKLKTKKDIYDYILLNYNDIRNNKYLYQGIKNHKIYEKLNKHFDSDQELYDYLNPSDKICRNKFCDKIRKFDRFTIGYKDFCCAECNNIWLSYSRTGDNNPCHSMSEDTKLNAAKIISAKLKAKIKSGEYTPKVTNSWCHSKHEIVINNKKINVRSSWEAFFYVLNPHLDYEKLRVQYIFEGIEHNYIVDFIDYKNKIVYEIKPNSLIDNNINTLKINALNNWCVVNNYKLFIISEDYFKNIKLDLSLLKSSPTYEKLKTLAVKYISIENLINNEN
ncbi:MAG: hypothetical protein RSF67_05585, partial [Clostridia bacterium]